MWRWETIFLILPTVAHTLLSNVSEGRVTWGHSWDCDVEG